MSIESLAIALHHSKAAGTVKLVLLGIANQDSDGGSFPKAATLAKYANVHPRRIPAALNKLVELGEIRIHERAGGTRNLPDHLRPNMYEITLECPPGCDRSKQHRERDADGELITYSRAQKGPKPRDRSRAAKPVDNSPLPGDANSTSAADSTTPGAADSTTPSAAGSTTKNHYLEPDLEPSGLALVSTSPGDGRVVICQACGNKKPILRGRYCSACTAAGLDSPIINCSIEGCDVVGRRRFPGQQYMLCPDHKQESQA